MYTCLCLCVARGHAWGGRAHLAGRAGPWWGARCPRGRRARPDSRRARCTPATGGTCPRAPRSCPSSARQTASAPPGTSPAHTTHKQVLLSLSLSLCSGSSHIRITYLNILLIYIFNSLITAISSLSYWVVPRIVECQSVWRRYLIRWYGTLLWTLVIDNLHGSGSWC